jgi:hypothetical protein
MGVILFSSLIVKQKEPQARCYGSATRQKDATAVFLTDKAKTAQGEAY